MPEMQSPELLDLAELAAKKRRVLWALLGNVVLLVVMLGGPFLRGILRAHELWRGFGRFGACLYGGQALEQGGLGLASGSEAHYAARLLGRSPDWPERCQTLLHELTPDQPIFLLPSVKRAENDVRAAAQLVEKELQAVLVRVPGERLSTRPLRAIEHLRAALARHALTAGVFEVPEADAFRLDPARGLPLATRVPLQASSDARVSLWGADSDFHALAIDGTGVSYVQVGAGGLSQTRLPRPKLLEGFQATSEGGFFVWAMPRSRCRERSEGCANKAVGVAALALPLSQLPLPRWLGAHPAGRVDRSMWFAGARVVIAAEAPGQRLSVREFELPGEPADKAQTELPPLPARLAFTGEAALEPWLTTIAGEPVVLSTLRRDEGTELVQLARDGPRALAKLPAGQDAWLTGSACADGAALSFGTEHALIVAKLSSEGSLTPRPALALPLTGVVHERDVHHDRVRNVCVPGGRALVLLRDAKDTLQAIACDESADACRVQPLVSDVQSFAVLALGEEVLVAFAGSKARAQIRLLTLDRGGQRRSPERVVAACWAPLGGLCGTPLLARTGSRVLLGAREGTDLLMLESPDNGAHWEPLRGLKRHY